MVEAYLWAFVNFEQNTWVRLLPITEFAYNNAKNTSIGYTPFELNYGYHPWMSCKKNIDPYSKLKSANELLSELWEVMLVCEKNLYYTQKLQKQVNKKVQSLEAMLLVSKFGWIANISEPNEIES